MISIMRIFNTLEEIGKPGGDPCVITCTEATGRMKMGTVTLSVCPDGRILRECVNRYGQCVIKGFMEPWPENGHLVVDRQGRVWFHISGVSHFRDKYISRKVVPYHTIEAEPGMPIGKAIARSRIAADCSGKRIVHLRAKDARGKQFCGNAIWDGRELLCIIPGETAEGKYVFDKGPKGKRPARYILMKPGPDGLGFQSARWLDFFRIRAEKEAKRLREEQMAAAAAAGTTTQKNSVQPAQKPAAKDARKPAPKGKPADTKKKAPVAAPQKKAPVAETDRNSPKTEKKPLVRIIETPNARIIVRPARHKES